jgi:PAS domain S-box-containing protein
VLALVVLALAVGYALAVSRYALESGRAEAARRVEVAYSSLVARTDAFFEPYILLYKSLRELPEVRNRDTAAMDRLFATMLAGNGEIENFAMTDERGLFLASGRPYDAASLPSVKDTEFFKRIAGGEDIAIMEPHQGPITRRPVTGVVVRLADGAGRFRGLLGSSIRLETLVAIWKELAVSQQVEFKIQWKDLVLVDTGLPADLVRTGDIVSARPSWRARDSMGLEHSVMEGRLAPFSATVYASAAETTTALSFLAGNPSLAGVGILLAGLLAFIVASGYRESSLAGRLSASEAKYRAYVDNSPIAIFVADGWGRYIDVNPAACAITGLSRERLLASGIADIVAPEEREEARASFSRLREHEGTTREGEFLRPNGERYYMTLDAVRISADRYLAFCMDSTERHRAEESMAKSLKEKQTLVREVHHRVKTSLSLLYAILEFEKARHEILKVETLSSIQGKIRAIALVHGNLYAAENLEYTEFGPYCRELLETIGRDRGAAPGRLVFKVEEAVFHIDTLLPLGLITAELYGNALEHAGLDSSIEVRLERRDQRFVLSVSDRGAGFAGGEPDIEFGSGLFIVRELSDQLGGELGFRNEEGACVSVEFPAAQGASEALKAGAGI